MNRNATIGLDIGSVTVKMAVRGLQWPLEIEDRTLWTDLFFKPDDLNGFDGQWIFSKAVPHHGEPNECAENLLAVIRRSVPPERVAGILLTGVGARHASRRLGAGCIQELRAMAESIVHFYPDVRTIFEVGGETSKYLLLKTDAKGSVGIVDYGMNGECAAGTGSFFDQQVTRLKYCMEEVGDVIRHADRSAPIAGRCSVFAKSDMIHAQQKGYLPADVLRGLCEAMARNFKTAVTKGKRIEPRIALIGGMALNPGFVSVFREVFDSSNGDIFVPQSPSHWSAMGAAMAAGRAVEQKTIMIPGGLEETRTEYQTVRPLSMERVVRLTHLEKPYVFSPGKVVDAFLGIDVGSVSTNLALIDPDGGVVDSTYTMTDGRPREVVTEALRSTAVRVGNHVFIRGVGVTGSGRELIGAWVGADVVKDEITAHKTGALNVARQHLHSGVDSIFEIGGQDSKFISIQGDTVVDFSLNEACAAGTGSFLEERAMQLGISIRNEFSEWAFRSRHPLRLGERCTVFMEKELVPYIHRGVPKEDIIAGLALSVVHNYLNRVVKKRKIGKTIFFQGGTAYNDSVAAAFSSVLDREIVVPPYPGILGAIGAALLVRDRMAGLARSTTFRGWDLKNVPHELRELTCSGCSNQCRVEEFRVGEEKLYWGDKCSERFRKRGRSHRKQGPIDLVRRRIELWEGSGFSVSSQGTGERGRIGIPRSLYFWERLPFWRVYFESLGFATDLSSATHSGLAHEGIEASAAEPCFPVQAAIGHILDAARRTNGPIFVPNVVNEEDTPGCPASYLCPWGQTLPLVAEHTPMLSGIKNRLMAPNVQFREGRRFVAEQLWRDFGKPNRIRKSEHSKAVEKAYQAQVDFDDQRRRLGMEIEDEWIGCGKPAVLLLGRPYSLYDMGLNLSIPTKLRDLYGVSVIPMDLVDLRGVDIRSVHPHMFWNYGIKILQAALWSKKHRDLHLVYLSHFKCGPDSYIRHYIEEASRKTFLFLQLDSHANDAGIMTRIEAFLESKKLV